VLVEVGETFEDWEAEVRAYRRWLQTFCCRYERRIKRTTSPLSHISTHEARVGRLSSLFILGVLVVFKPDEDDMGKDKATDTTVIGPLASQRISIFSI
jgi:hypothetical protein